MRNPPEANGVNDALVVGLLDAIWSVAEGNHWFLSKNQSVGREYKRTVA